MKHILYSFIFLASFNAFSLSTTTHLEVTADEGSLVKIALLENELDESEVELLWELGGRNALFYGDFCYSGFRKQAAKIIELLFNSDDLGLEYSVYNIDLENNYAISYDVIDSDQKIVTQNTVYPCE
ncbi:MAG: hypothetical protein H6621_07580 [Halobacteriovoraceae bacterium]|nr:hypothetical protein [Halobacteriovoraceae bacterium]